MVAIINVSVYGQLVWANNVLIQSVYLTSGNV